MTQGKRKRERAVTQARFSLVNYAISLVGFYGIVLEEERRLFPLL